MSIKKVKGHQYLRHIFDHGPISNSWQIKFRQENKSHDVHSFAAIHYRFMEVLAVSPRRAGGGSKTEQNERYGFASFSGLNV